MSGLTGKEKSRNHRIGVIPGGSGFMAVRLADYEDMDWATDIVQTGEGRYLTREQALEEAKEWAEAEELPLEGASQ